MGRQFFTLLAAALMMAMLAAPPQISAMESADCFGCHADAEMVGADLTIEADVFDHTAHGELGCAACHPSVTDTHPDDGLAPAKADCQDCHRELAEEYARSEHAGNAACGDCHNPHQVRGPSELSGHDMNRQCAACHDSGEMNSAHGAWLPQADLHLEVLPCISCHTGSEGYVINLFVTRRQSQSGAPMRGVPFELAAFSELKAIAQGEEIASLIDADHDGTISLGELRQFNGSSRYSDLRLQGTMMPETLTHNLQIHDNRWDCTFCHASGPDAMQTSYLALPREDGSYQRLPVEQGAVLDLLNGTPDFYMLGATRSTALNYIGLAIIAGGLVMPIGHGTLRFLTRKNRR